MRRFYVATTLSNWAAAKHVTQQLELTCRWENTYKWWLADAAPGANGAVARTREAWGKQATLEMKAVTRADYIIALVPFGFGTCAEFGAALALGHEVAVFAPDEESLFTQPNGSHGNVFSMHPAVDQYFGSLDDCITKYLDDSWHLPTVDYGRVA